jgi:Domain of unknown function (DUF222)/HNH endonuclease
MISATYDRPIGAELVWPGDRRSGRAQPCGTASTRSAGDFGDRNIPFALTNVCSFCEDVSMSAGDATARLHEAIDLVAGIDVSELPTAEALAELLEELTRCTRRLDFEFHRLLRSFEARGDHEPLGYRTAKQWCRDRLRVSDASAATSLKLGRMLIDMPGVSTRWAAGDLGAEHASSIASVRTDETREASGEWEGWLARQAVDLDMRGLRKVLAKWRLEVDPDSAEPERIERDRDAHVSATFQGAVVVDALLDAIGGAAFKTVFDGIVEELFQADWAAAKTRLGRDPLTSELARTHAQRRADALVVMAQRAHVANPSAAARLRPLVVVVAGLDALAGGLAELWNETPLSPRQLARILGQDADLERYVYGPGEVPIAYNERHRFFTGKLRRAIQVRDRHCTARGCDRPAEYCDIDHIDPYGQGGATRPDNGRVACNPDNRARPRRRFHGDPDP